GMPPGMGMGMPTPDPAAAMRPGMMAPPMPPHGMIQPLATPTGRPAWMDRLGLPKTSLPPRTWGLVVVTGGALVFAVFLGRGGRGEARRRAVRRGAERWGGAQAEHDRDGGADGRHHGAARRGRDRDAGGYAGDRAGC